MKVNGVVLRKIEIIRETVAKLRELDDLTTTRLEQDLFLKKGVERALQVCVEAVIDIAHRIISLESGIPASTAAKALEGIKTLGAISSIDTYKPMVQFRNIVVHRYETVDNEVLIGICQRHLGDFDRYTEEVMNYARSQS
jgi:uncharacterized protein YutE (UPF0331/DUF86 family)